MGGKSATTFTNVDLKNVVLGVTTFVRIFGDSLVPKLFTIPNSTDLHAAEWPSEIHGMKLGSWVQDIRRAYKRRQLSQEFIDALNTIEFAWSHKEYLLEGIHLPAIRKYREIYNTLDIPLAFIIPAQESWERKTWGLKLGRIYSSLKAKYMDSLLLVIDGKLKISEDGTLYEDRGENRDDLSPRPRDILPKPSTKPSTPVNDASATKAPLLPPPLPLSERYNRKLQGTPYVLTPKASNSQPNTPKGESPPVTFPQDRSITEDIADITQEKTNQDHSNNKTSNRGTSESHVALIQVLKAKNHDLKNKINRQHSDIEQAISENKNLRMRLGVLRQEMQSHVNRIDAKDADLEELKKKTMILEEQNSKLIQVNEQMRKECYAMEGNDDFKERIKNIQHGMPAAVVPEKTPSPRSRASSPACLDDSALLRLQIESLEKEKLYLGRELSSIKIQMSRKRRKLETMSHLVATTFRAVLDDMNEDDFRQE